MGTPDFAVECLDKLLKSKHSILGVVTSEDKKAGRGKKIKSSPVKETAIINNISVLQPYKLMSDDFVENLNIKMVDMIVKVVKKFRIDITNSIYKVFSKFKLII